MNSFFSRTLALLACIHLLGGHWAALQVVAWGGMLWSNLQETSLTLALTETFDGAHPCDLCDSIVEGREKEGDQKTINLESKPVAILSLRAGLPALRSVDLFYPAVTCRAETLPLSLPSPPPRHA